ncbi:Uncharacterized protein YhaN [Evansella caseinilytica]|uniref:Uncharacterized protein YhaN n=1 Tax=Evansella caseinilytica TaxID=1503961 RepID=A0A1H3K157_9BACI|nr:AAA family ATPase [Evansella caseinilytica]SDY45589.1 Uncharacterized protein YhaN [Evansella caseinilytica]
MRIENIHIYGYGKWEDKQWDVSGEGIHVFLGRNESGKSTLMSFIQSILFGFPKKGGNQYIPYSGTAYGGKLSLVMNDGRKIAVERVKGRKAKGDVTVYEEDGRSAGEERLAELLKGVDLATFQGVFHFDLDGLSNIADMNPVELNQFLYDTGLGGGRSISGLENALQTEMEQLFRPRGKKTEMNALAFQLEKKEQDIHEWNKRLDQYDRLKERIRSKERQWQENRQQQRELTEKLKQTEKAAMLQPLAKEWEERRLLLQETARGDLNFPEEGVARLETLHEKLMEKQAAIRDEQHQQLLLEQELESITLHEQWPEIKKELSQKIQEYDFTRKDWEKLEEYKLDIERLDRQLDRLEKQWLLNRQHRFSDIPFSPYLKHTLLSFKTRLTSTDESIRRLSEEKNRLEMEVEYSAKELESEESKLLRVEEAAELQKAMDQFKEEEHFHFERKLLEEQLSDKQAQGRRLLAAEKRQQTAFLLLAVVVFFLAAASYFISEQTAAIFLLSVAMVLFATFYWKKRSASQLQADIKKEENRLLRKIEEWHNEHHRQADPGQIERWKNSLVADQKRKLRVDAVKYQLREKTARRNRAVKELQQLRADEQTCAVELHRWCGENNLPTDEALAYYEGLLTAAEEWQQLEKERHDLIRKSKNIEKSKEAYIAGLKELARRTNLPEDRPAAALIEKLKDFLAEQERLENEKQQLRQMRQHRRESQVKLSLVMEDLMQQQQVLFEKAGAADEESFRRKGTEYRRRQELSAEMQQLWIQMKLIFPVEKELRLVIERLLYDEYDPQLELERLKESLQLTMESGDELVNTLAELKEEAAALERDGTYENLLQDFSQMKEELQTLAKKWATLAVSRQIVGEIKHIYEQEKQPAVIREAGQLFKIMTGGEYVRLFAPLGEERFVLERADGVRFEPMHVSRGTCELLYLALRLSLATLFTMQANFPIFMDEVLVNIDKERREKVIAALRKLAETRQIIFFTCHPYIEKEVGGKVIIL